MERRTKKKNRQETDDLQLSLFQFEETYSGKKCVVLARNQKDAKLTCQVQTGIDYIFIDSKPLDECKESYINSIPFLRTFPDKKRGLILLARITKGLLIQPYE